MGIRQCRLPLFFFPPLKTLTRTLGSRTPRTRFLRFRQRKHHVQDANFGTLITPPQLLFTANFKVEFSWDGRYFRTNHLRSSYTIKKLVYCLSSASWIRKSVSFLVLGLCAVYPQCSSTLQVTLIVTVCTSSLNTPWPFGVTANPTFRGKMCRWIPSSTLGS